MLNEEVATWLDAFRDIVRPHRGTLEPTEPLSATTSGEKVTNLSNNISIPATEVNKERGLKPTAARKVTATIAAGLGSDVQRQINTSTQRHIKRRNGKV